MREVPWNRAWHQNAKWPIGCVRICPPTCRFWRRLPKACLHAVTLNPIAPKFLGFAGIGLDLLQGFQNLVSFSHIHYRNVHHHSGNHEQAPDSRESVILHFENLLRNSKFFHGPRRRSIQESIERQALSGYRDSGAGYNDREKQLAFAEESYSFLILLSPKMRCAPCYRNWGREYSCVFPLRPANTSLPLTVRSTRNKE